MRARASCEFTKADAAVIESLDNAINNHMSDEETERVVTAAEKALGDKIRGFDAIGLCFPDVVIKDKVVGGEAPKTRGIRENAAVEYEAEFRKLTDLNDILSAY